MSLDSQIMDLLMQGGACDVGTSQPVDGPEMLHNAISFVIPLSDYVLDQIVDSPTFSYFHHYRTVNALIDQLILRAGIFLQQNGYSYMPVAASQSQPQNGQRNHTALYSHKKAAVLAGLGTIGKSSLFLHRKYGPRVRLGTIFTNYEFHNYKPEDLTVSLCGNCDLCSKACPAGAIKGNDWYPGCERETLIDPWLCNEYMRDHFMKIGRGAVCGICISSCPIRVNSNK